jgi:hypothetical protein
MFVPGVLLTLGGKYSLYVHAVVFALVHTTVYHYLSGALGSVGIKVKPSHPKYIA